jgi:hypothetical protein
VALKVFLPLGQNSDKIPDTLKVSAAASIPTEGAAVRRPELT